MRRLSFLLALAVFLLAAGEARAGTLFVTTLSDASVVVHDCATKSNGDCSLRSALTQVNSDPPGDTITFTVSGTITLTSSLPPLSFNGVTINGPGANQLTISGAGRYQVFNGSSSGSLTISGLTITDGSASFGGAVSRNNGGLTISDCVFTGNVASSEGGGGLWWRKQPHCIRQHVSGQSRRHQRWRNLREQRDDCRQHLHRERGLGRGRERRRRPRGWDRYRREQHLRR